MTPILKNTLLALCVSATCYGGVVMANQAEVAPAVLKLEEMWEKKASAEEMLEYLEKHQSEIPASEVLFKRGWIYLRKGEYDQARTIFREGADSYTDEAPRFLLGIADSYVQSWHHGKLDKDKEKAHVAYQALIKEIPNYPLSYAQYSLLLLIEGDFEKAALYAEKSNELSPSAYASRNLVIAYERLGKYEPSLYALERVYELDKSFFTDKDMMISAALSYSETEQFEQAFGVMRELLSHDEALKLDTQVIETVGILKAKLSESIDEDNKSQ